MPVPTATTKTTDSSLLPYTMSEKEKPASKPANFKPLSREEFAKATYGKNKYWFTKHYSKGQSLSSRFLEQAAKCLSLKSDDPHKQEADQLLDAMRNDPDFYTEEMLKKACGGKEPEKVGRARTTSSCGGTEPVRGGRARNSSSASSLKENIAPYANKGLSNRFTNSEYDDDDDVFRSDGVIVETPTEARGIEDDGDDDFPPPRAMHEDGNYKTPSNSRLSTVVEESKGKKESSSSRKKPVCVDPDSDDDDGDEYDDGDDYHDVMGHEFGKESFYDDYRGEYDGSYNDY
ncbi:hypothetical protein BLS_000587 [Venturia inaequalis]|uniref:Uncharacterized protein n=1 Tax=Venturia inaequalis TaxID=5025 RepID=A0A8H3YLQ7_VENIN|nr:hypothetical protein BLS_000587 [Venturia inaequalis]